MVALPLVSDAPTLYIVVMSLSPFSYIFLLTSSQEKL